MKLGRAAFLTITAMGLVLSPSPLQAQPRLCFTVSIADEPGLNVYAGDRFETTDDGSGEPSYITGDVMGSRVNVRPGPGTEYESDGSYGLVGDYVNALGWGYDQNCEAWFLVQFPQSKYEGWVKGDYIEFVYGRGLFD